MFKKLIVLFSVTLLFNCKTVEIGKEETFIPKIANPEKIEAPKPEDLARVRQALSDNVLSMSDPDYSDFAIFVLDIIRQKKWDSFSEMTNLDFYNSYVIENNGSLIDYSMYMLHTGDEGISTNYSLNEISTAYYTESYIIDDNAYYEGVYIYPSGESEFFKLMIQDSEMGKIITRE